MAEQRKRSDAARDQPDDFEWVNAWAAARTRAPKAVHEPLSSPHVPARQLTVVAGTDLEAVVAPAEDVPAQFDRDLLLAGDIIDIAQARDALLADSSPPPRQTAVPSLVWLPAGLSRTADSVPIILGSVLGFLIVVVFATAAVFVKLAR